MRPRGSHRASDYPPHVFEEDGWTHVEPDVHGDVRSRDLLPGDVIPFGGTWATVVGFDAIGRLEIEHSRPSGTLTSHSSMARWTGVVRRVQQPQTNVVVGDSFPHRCPMCAAPAYLGFLGVQHRDESGSGACAARRL